jgi:hypothetical protein
LPITDAFQTPRLGVSTSLTLNRVYKKSSLFS